MNMMILNIKDKLNMNRKRVVAAFVIGFLALLGIFIYVLGNQEVLTGKVVIEQESGSESINAGNAGTIVQEKKGCSSGCNPSNMLQFCSGGKWFDCPSGKVCSLGNCVVAESASRITGGSGGSGGGSTTTTTTVVVSESQPEVYELSQIETEKTIEIAGGDSANFNINGNDYSITLKSNTGTEGVLRINSQIYNLKIGSSQTAVDYDLDASIDFFVKIKSISAINGKVTLVIRK